MYKILLLLTISLGTIKLTESSIFQFLSSELFVLPLLPTNFSFAHTDGILYQPSLVGLPDLPSWLYYTYSSKGKLGYVYGTPPSGHKNIKLEVIATDRSQYNVSRRIYNINIVDDPYKKFRIQIKLRNLEVSDVLLGKRLSHLVDIIVENLWPESRKDGVITDIKRASVMGDRLPLSPTDKEGVYVYYGSNTPFSQELKELEVEVKPLWAHRPCPKYFKKSSYERYFQQEGLSVDWCTFKLQRNHPENAKLYDYQRQKANSFPIFQETPVKLFKKSEVVTRSYILDVINTLVIPMLVMLVLLALLTLAMCCHRSNIVPNIHEIQMVQYMGINKGFLTPKLRKNGTGESPHPSMITTATHLDTLPRSRTTSPASTLNRTTPSRKFEDYETLTRPKPPPYQRA